MSLVSKLVSQFGNPRGALGRVAGRIMAAKSDNRERGRWTIELLALSPSDEVLELGYGPGVVAGWICEEVPGGSVVGIDQSATMHRQASRRNRTEIAAGRLDLKVGDAEALPADLGEFDAICSMNVWQFWNDAESTLVALRAHLRPGGQVAVTYLQPVAQARSADEAETAIVQQMKAAELIDIRVERLRIGKTDAICCLARRPS